MGIKIAYIYVKPFQAFDYQLVSKKMHKYFIIFAARFKNVPGINIEKRI